MPFASAMSDKPTRNYTQSERVRDFLQEQANICGKGPIFLAEDHDIRDSAELPEYRGILAGKRTFKQRFFMEEPAYDIAISPEFTKRLEKAFMVYNRSEGKNQKAKEFIGRSAIQIRQNLGKVEYDRSYKNTLKEFAFVGVTTALIGITTNCVGLLMKKNNDQGDEKKLALSSVEKLIYSGVGLGLSYLFNNNIAAPLYNKYKERKADEFAIAHTTEADFIKMAADYYSNEYDKEIKSVYNEIYYFSPGFKTESPDQISQETQKFKEFVNSWGYGNFSSNRAHYERFARAAEKLMKQNN